MTLYDLGFNKTLEHHKIEQNLTSFKVGRIIKEHRERYIIKNDIAVFDGELIGNLRYSANNRYDLPAVGDWVAFTEYDDNKALIYAIYPRSSIIERQAVGKTGQVQIIATNIDFGFIVQAVDRDFNINRLERYLTICNASHVTPVIILNKVDLITESALETIIDNIARRIKNTSIITSSNLTEGYSQITKLIEKGKTYCLLGSSGVGKSTILNAIAGSVQMKVNKISSSVNKGKHTTTHRALIVLKSGGVIIDTPGMRELGIADTFDGLETTFESILEHAQNCKFKDCSHTGEKGCAVIEAIENGDIDEGAYHNFSKMVKEKQHFEMDVSERRKKDKAFGKMVKQVKKRRKDSKF
ncbi:ribosome small subunit-dependent GTPase A [Flavivirga eckloniae]|uniref:Small ribosomal subunit biogenesis GTPase RsgA n=1 Tax=Flavivirga eckloniae TaxID=1803846 RepID=A0A2K9PUH9_9FLAO|nr:ribosome small subunit-dependent GTPase A [Flavivirga eckloniae]AUP80704.1 ribosome small subunit-dependent GTPase A [Flavivirga eckloniae]